MAIQCCFERYEKKYCLTLSQQRFLLERMTPYMKKDAYGEYTICNIYYDTDDYRLIRASLEKPVYKEKLRVRSYGVPTDGGRVFAEIKKKYDGVVYKRRITASPADAAAFLRTGQSAQPLGQIGREIAWFQHTYHAGPKVFLAYDRAAFSGADDPAVRITCDAWLDAIAPDAAIISVGYNNYGHPTAETLARLQAHDIPIYRTDRMGDVTVHLS